MTTLIDLHLLKTATPLLCVERLTELTRSELWTICNYLALRVTKKADKTELVGLITTHLHPGAALPPPAATDAQQLSLF